MPRHARWIAIGILAITHTATAQSVGFQLDRFEPAPAGDAFFEVEAPWYSSTRLFAGGLTLDYAHDLLATAGGPAPIGNALGGHLDLAGAVSDRVALSFSLPLVLAESGTTMFGVGPSGTAAGDPRFGARVRIFGQPAHDQISLSGSAYVWVPVGQEGKLAGDAQVRVMSRISAGAVIASRVRWATTVGYFYRDEARLSPNVSPVGSSVGPEVQIAGGAQYLAFDRRLSIGPEAKLAVSVGNLPAGQSSALFEVLLGAHYHLIAQQLTVGVGLGGGVAGSPGAPDVRAVVSIAYTPGRHRVERETIERVIVMPDEEGHVGAVEVNDGKHVTLLDTAYASSEVGNDGKTKRVQSSPQAIAQRLGPLTRTLPPSDRDGDGILDANDACPDRVGIGSTDPLRTGCPESKEKVVVLPEEDGHVGGVEVNDGTGVTVLDKAYASSEVAPDGSAHAVPPSTARAVDHSVAELIKQLPVADRDGDGLIDANDACPDRAGVPSTDALRNGCPPSTEKVVVLPDADGHIGGLEVNDGKTVTVLDKAYASSEVAPDGTAHAVPDSPARAIDHSVAALARQLPIGDRDGDGVADAVDACPERAGPASPDPVRNGCPRATEKVVVLPDEDGHVGGVEVNDGKTVTVLDKAYATSEVGTDGQARAVASSLPAVVSRSIAAVAATLPRADRDGDGILDKTDACPDRAGAVNADPTRNGCPKAVETVIVLPDENGHVGGVEVNDGTTVTVLDRAYATSEVGVDGMTQKVETPATQVAETFAGALAAQPAGVRMVIFFNNRAEPVEDLSGPIANLVAEIQDRAHYTVDVVGHTDALGTASANQKLGLERAQLIVDRLIAAGVPADRVRASSKGSSEPMQRSRASAVERRNRRVEVFVK